MEWFGFLIFILAIYGMSNQIVFTSGPFNIYDHIKVIANKIHPSLYHLLTCMICLPTWFGLGFSILDIWVLNDITFTPANILMPTTYWWFILLIDGAIASGVIWLIHSIQSWFETNIPIIEETNTNIEVLKQNKEILND